MSSDREHLARLLRTAQQMIGRMMDTGQKDFEIDKANTVCLSCFWQEIEEEGV